MSESWILILTTLAVRLPALLRPAAWGAPVAPLGPLAVWLQAWTQRPAESGAGAVLILLQIFCDAASVLLLLRLVERRRLAERLLSSGAQPPRFASPAFWAGLAWAAHPVAGFLAGPAGAWQSLALLGLLLAAWNLEFSRHPGAQARGAWALGLAIGAALWPLLLLPLASSGLLSRRARLRFCAQALALPLLLLLPWLLLKDSATVLQAWQGSPSVLGLEGVLRSLWSAAAAPPEMLGALIKGWTLVALPALALWTLLCFWRPPALLPGLALGAWVWVLLAPQLQSEQLLTPLALLLLLPGRLAWRLGASTFLLLLLRAWLPGLPELAAASQEAGAWRALHLCWCALLLAWLGWVLLEGLRLNTYARRPQRASQYF